MIWVIGKIECKMYIVMEEVNGVEVRVRVVGGSRVGWWRRRSGGVLGDG